MDSSIELPDFANNTACSRTAAWSNLAADPELRSTLLFCGPVNKAAEHKCRCTAVVGSGQSLLAERADDSILLFSLVSAVVTISTKETLWPGPMNSFTLHCPRPPTDSTGDITNTTPSTIQLHSSHKVSGITSSSLFIVISSRIYIFIYTT